MEQYTQTGLSQIREKTDYNDIVQYILVIQRLALNENGFDNLTIDFNVLERIIVEYMNQYLFYSHHNYQKVAKLKNKIIVDTDKQDREDTNNQLAILLQSKEYKRYAEGTYMDKQIKESALRRDIRQNIINIVFKRINEHHFKYQINEDDNNDKKESPLNTSTHPGYPTYHASTITKNFYHPQMMAGQANNYNPLSQQVSPQLTYQQLLNQVHNPAWLKQNLLTYLPAHETVHPVPHPTINFELTIAQPLDKGKNVVEDLLIKERSKQVLVRGTHDNYEEASDIHDGVQNPHVFTRDDASDAQLRNILSMDRIMRGSGQSLLEDVVSPYQTKQGESSNKLQQGSANNPHSKNPAGSSIVFN
uniref:Bromodomain associated domain-containing protein n=1 Tax=Meloidogyne javanica TaxID=6303 RepID=A0A915M5A7_MELJA